MTEVRPEQNELEQLIGQRDMIQEDLDSGAITDVLQKSLYLDDLENLNREIAECGASLMAGAPNYGE